MKFGPWWENLGLSGAAAILLMVRVAATWPTVGWPEAIGLFLCLCVHYGKNYFVANQNADRDSVMSEVSQLSADVQNLEAKVSGISLNLGIKSSVGDEG